MSNVSITDNISTKANASARRVQRSIAFGVVVVPMLGFIAAMILLVSRGIEFRQIALLVFMYTVTIIGSTVGFHRHFAHNSFKTSQPVRILLAILGSMSAQGPLIFWVAVHRRHHAYSDQLGDPHSPNLSGNNLLGRLRGLYHAHIGWMFTEEQTNWAKFARDILQDRTLLRIHQQYFFWLMVGLIIPAILGGLITWNWNGVLVGFLWGGLVRIFLVNQAMWCVGSICHYFGSRPFQTHDRSGNLHWVAFFTFGEGLQNNHHAFPASARHGLTWWQPDFSGWIIRAMQAMGIAWDVKHPSSRAILEARKHA